MFWKKPREVIKQDWDDRYNWSGNMPESQAERQLVGRAVAAARAIPLLQWKCDPNQEKNKEQYSAVSKGGAVILVCRDKASNTIISVDGQVVHTLVRGSVSWASDGEGSDDCGYKDLGSWYYSISHEMSRREKELERPAREAQEAEKARLKAEREANERKRVNDILRRL